MAWRFRRKTTFFFSFLFIFLNEPIAGTPRHVCKTFSRIHSKIWLRRPKVDSILKRSSYYMVQYVSTQITRVFRTKVQTFTSCFGDRSWNLAHVFCESLPGRWHFLGGVCVYFPTKKLYLLRQDQIPPKKQKKKYLAKKQPPPFPIRQGLGRGS